LIQSESNPLNRLLDLIHSIVFGPIKFPSISKVLYYISFIDDYSRRIWIYFLITESDVFNGFKELKSLLENQIGKKIKLLSTDNGDDFFPTEFDKFCKENYIEIHKKNPYTPQHNGVS
jgi:transposase InsO family protein